MNFQDSEYRVFDFNIFFSRALSPRVFIKDDVVKIFFAGERDSKKTRIYSIDLINNKELNLKLCIDLFKEKINRVMSPDIIFLKDTYVMFFEARIHQYACIYISYSKDLINWEVNPQPFLYDKDLLIKYGTPNCVFHKSKRLLYLYFYSEIKQIKSINLIILDENLKTVKKIDKPVIFSENFYEQYSVYSPFVSISESSWSMIYAGWGKNPIKGYILHALSKDGINWHKSKSPVLKPSIKYDNKHCSEPSIYQYGKKNFLLYEGCSSSNRWKIVSRN